MRTTLHKAFHNLNLFNKLVLLVNLIAVAILIISFASSYISPKTSLVFAYLGLLYPVWLFCNLGFILFWTFQRKYHGLISLFAIILGMVPLSRFVTITLFTTHFDKDKSIEVMSFNARVFDLYNWTGNIESKNNIITFLNDENPDVICFQEYYRGEGVHFNMRDTLQELLGYEYVHETIVVTKKEIKGTGKNYFGSAIFSKLPIVNSKDIYFSNDKNNHFSYADIVKGIDTIRFFNAHIGSMRLQNADYKLIGGDDNKKWEGEKQSEQDILSRMNLAFEKRTLQTVTMMKEIIKSPYPIVLCMDLNDTPSSYAYNKVAKNLTDAFVKSGFGIGSTYIGENTFNDVLPVNRIDYIFTSKEVISGNFVTHQVQLSDHKPISCTVQVEE